MSEEDEAKAAEVALADAQVAEAMMSKARRDAMFLQCLPAQRGEEVAASVIDGRQSRVWKEAENRLHAQKALLEFLVQP